MKILGLVIQNKKGTNLLIASSTAISTRLCIIYSHVIFEHILESYRSRLKIQRTITLDYDLVCAVNISKDYILYIFSTKNDLSLAFDAIRKITDHFNRPGSTPANRIENIQKKFVEYMCYLEEFLYCREIPSKEYIPMLSQPHSKRKILNHQIFNKFSHISSESDKNLILETEKRANLKQERKVIEKCIVLDSAEAFQIKGQDQIYLLDVADQQKEQYIHNYRKNIMKLAMGKRRPSQRMIQSRGRSNSTIFMENREEEDITVYLDETTMERQKIKLKMMEKLALHLHGQKVKEVHQLGQIIVEGTQQQKAKILLHSNFWKNPKVLGKRLSPNSLESKMIGETQIQFKTVPNYKSKPIVDYVMRTEIFSPEKIPLLFISSMEVNSNNIQFTFKYKMNEKWKHRIYDFDINVYLNKQFIVLDCRSIPVAHSLKNNKVTWKTKEIIPGGSNSKGKILLAFGQAKFPPKKIISEIKLSMKSNCGIIEGLEASCQQDWGYESKAERTLILEYKISPN